MEDVRNVVRGGRLTVMRITSFGEDLTFDS